MSCTEGHGLSIVLPGDDQGTDDDVFPEPSSRVPGTPVPAATDLVPDDAPRAELVVLEGGQLGIPARAALATWNVTRTLFTFQTRPGTLTNRALNKRPDSIQHHREYVKGHSWVDQNDRGGFWDWAGVLFGLTIGRFMAAAGIWISELRYPINFFRLLLLIALIAVIHHFAH